MNDQADTFCDGGKQVNGSVRDGNNGVYDEGPAPTTFHFGRTRHDLLRVMSSLESIACCT